MLQNLTLASFGDKPVQKFLRESWNPATLGKDFREFFDGSRETSRVSLCVINTQGQRTKKIIEIDRRYPGKVFSHLYDLLNENRNTSIGKASTWSDKFRYAFISSIRFSSVETSKRGVQGRFSFFVTI